MYLDVDFVAEISANHLHSLERTKILIQEAAKAGATSVKFQTYTPDTMTLDHENFKVSDSHPLWGGRKLYELYNEAYLPWEWHSELFEHAIKFGLVPFSTPFDLTALDFLESINCPKYKIASLETSDHELIESAAKTGKPLIVSTGATLFDEIEELVLVARQSGCQDLTLLVCTSSYPADPIDSHIKRMDLLSKTFNCKVGISDHTLGIGVGIASIALGARVIEKHFTISRSDGGADAAFSLEPNEFKSLVLEGNAALKSLGKSSWSIQNTEEESRNLRRSLYIVKNVKKGDVVTRDNVRPIRPGSGSLPKHLKFLLGKKFRFDFDIGTPMHLDHAE